MMVFLAVPFQKITLEHYATQKECQVERNRIGFEMAESYPDAHEFDIVCQLSARAV
jgi:hypothetical protein